MTEREVGVVASPVERASAQVEPEGGAVNLRGGSVNRGVESAALGPRYGERMDRWATGRAIAARWPTSPLVVPAVLAVVASAEVGSNADIPHRLIAAPCTLLMVAVLVARRRAPVVVSLLVGVAFFVQTAAGVPVQAQVSTSLALAVAAFAAGRHGGRTGAFWGLGIVVATVLICSVVSGDSGPAELVPAVVVFAASWLAGAVLARRAEQVEHSEERAAFAESTAQARAQEAVDLERRRIARELHDVVAHAITVMVLQAGAVQMVLPANDDDSALRSLHVIQDTGRRALVDMKHLLGILRAPDHASLAPMASLAGIPNLVDEMSATGLLVALSIDGELGGCPTSIGSSVYQVTREALTNTLRHAGAAHASVALRCHGHQLDLEVLDDGHGHDPGIAGYGLLGMRERVAAFGGRFDAGARPEGGFAIHASFPFDATAVRR
jgi:signal transduction histidine kinase